VTPKQIEFSLVEKIVKNADFNFMHSFQYCGLSWILTTEGIELDSSAAEKNREESGQSFPFFLLDFLDKNQYKLYLNSLRKNIVIMIKNKSFFSGNIRHKINHRLRIGNHSFKIEYIFEENFPEKEFSCSHCSSSLKQILGNL